MKLRKYLLAIAILGTAFGGFKYWEKETLLSVVPRGFGVSKIIYRAEESWGFGPGGNETGLIIFELPKSTAEKIVEEGKSYLESTRQNNGFGESWRGSYEAWYQTPVLVEGDGGGPNRTRDYEIAHYLDRYGFGILIAPDIEQEINDSLSKPGCYLAWGRIGFLLVIPKAKKVVFAYNG